MADSIRDVPDGTGKSNSVSNLWTDVTIGRKVLFPGLRFDN